MLFQKKGKKLSVKNEVKITDVVISITNNTKFLGVYIDQHLSFQDHIRYIKGKISRGIGILCKARKVLNKSTLLTLYYSFIHPYFTYCITIWGNTFLTALTPLIRCQKRAIRIISGAKRLDSTSPLFKQMEILNFERLYIYSVHIFLYKYHHNMLPNIFDNFFVNVSDIHGHFTRQTSHFRAPYARSHQRTSALKSAGARIYNKFVKNLNYDCSLPCFKQNCKKLLVFMPDKDIMWKC